MNRIFSKNSKFLYCLPVLMLGILLTNFAQSAQPTYLAEARLAAEIIPNPEDENWSKGFAAFSNYDYEAAIKYLTASNEILAKYYLAKIYFGDVEVNNLERKPSPPIDRNKALTILGQYLGYSEIKGLLNDYLSLNADKKRLSEFYFEMGNYEEAIKVRESISAKPSKEDNLFMTKCRYFQGVEQRFITQVRDTKGVLRQTDILPLQQRVATQKESVEPPTPNRVAIEEIGELPVVDVDEKSYPEPALMATVPPAQAILPLKQMVVAVKEAIVWDRPAIPNTYYKALIKIKQGTIVSILDATSVEWYYKVCLPDEQIGWICSVLLKEMR